MIKSSTDIAYDLLKENKGGLHFDEIWAKVVEEKGYTEEEKIEKISPFYTDIVLDGRFITHGEKIWDLREDNPSDKFHIDMNDVYASDNDEIIEDEEGYDVIAKEDLLIDEDDEDEIVIKDEDSYDSDDDLDNEIDIDSGENLEDELEIVQDIDETD